MAIPVFPLRSVYHPATVGELSEIVRDHAARGEPLYPQGGQQSLRYGATATREGCGVDLTGFNRCIDYPADDLTITVETGMTFREVSAILAEKNQRLTWDVPDAETATIGGILATAWSGPRRYRWGTVRDSVVGMKLVDGNGSLIRSGGRVVKNAAGYDMGRLFCGSMGTFGMLTEVTLAVRPFPETHAWVLCRHPFPQRTEELFHTLDDLIPSAILLALGDVADASDGGRTEFLRGSANGSTSFDTASLNGLFAVEFEGEASEVGWMLDETLQRWTQLGLSPQEVLDEDSEPILHRFASACMGDGIRTGIAAFSFPSEVVRLAQTFYTPSTSSDTNSEEDAYAIQGDAVKRGICRSVLADLGTGSLRAITDQPRTKVFPWLREHRRAVSCESQPAPTTSGMIRSSDLTRAVTSLTGCRLVIADAPQTDCWDIPTVWGEPSPNYMLYATMKREFDPAGILNPGRYIFS